MPSSVRPPIPARRLLLPSLVLGLVACGAGDRMGDSEPLGRVTFATTCDPSVEEDFNRAVALLHHMTYPGAQASFREVADRDPDCAMAYWGMAMTLFQPLWPTRPDEAALAEGGRLVRRARTLVKAGTWEDRWVASGEAFFDSAGAPDYWTRIDRWAAATTAVHEADPDDAEAAAFFALGLLATSARTDDPAGQNARAAAVLSDILAVEPTHPGAVHYTIHANDFDGRERESLDLVRGYGDIAPQNPHALHMPTHIFVRLGEWADVVEWNERAAEAALGQRTGPSGEYVWDEFPHALEYLVYAHLQTGNDATVERVIRQLEGTADLQPSFKTAFHLASMPARLALERQDWAGAAGLPPRRPDHLDWDRFPWPEAVVWHARGLGAAHLGRHGEVDESLRHLASLARRAADSGETLFESQIRILELEVRGWQALEKGETELAVTSLEEAALLESRTPKHPVTPGATLPARELLGELHMALGRPAEALASFEESNVRTPGRLNTLLGLARASLALADSASAATYYGELLATSSRSSDRPGILEARAFLDGV